MSQAKVPLQVYLSRQDRDDYNKICKIRDIKAAEELRWFVRKQLNKHKELLK